MVDGVLDCVGGTALEKGFSCCNEGGIMVSVAKPPKDDLKERHPGVKGLYFVVEPVECN